MIISDLAKKILEVEAAMHRGCYVKLITLPESIGGAASVQIIDIKKLEIEDDGSLTIVVEN